MSDIHGKSLQELGLRGLSDAPLPTDRTGDSAPDYTSLSIGDLPSLRSALLAFIKANPYKQFNYDNAWRCTNCNTINGTVGSKKVLRKTCDRCKRARSNNLTVIEELINLGEAKVELKESESAFDKVTEDLL